MNFSPFVVRDCLGTCVRSASMHLCAEIILLCHGASNIAFGIGEVAGLGATRGRLLVCKWDVIQTPLGRLMTALGVS